MMISNVKRPGSAERIESTFNISASTVAPLSPMLFPPRFNLRMLALPAHMKEVSHVLCTQRTDADATIGQPHHGLQALASKEG